MASPLRLRAHINNGPLWKPKIFYEHDYKLWILSNVLSSSKHNVLENEIISSSVLVEERLLLSWVC